MKNWIISSVSGSAPWFLRLGFLVSWNANSALWVHKVVANSSMFIKLSWDLLAPSAHIAFDCLIGVYANLTPCSLSSNGDMVWSCRNKQNRGFCLFLFSFFAMEILKWRKLCRHFSVRGRTFPWFGENISSLLSEQQLPQYFWVAMAAESIFILAFSVLWSFLLLLPVGDPSAACTGSEWHLVLSLLRIAQSAAVQVSWSVTRFSKTCPHRGELSSSLEYGLQ